MGRKKRERGQERETKRKGEEENKRMRKVVERREKGERGGRGREGKGEWGDQGRKGGGNNEGKGREKLEGDRKKLGLKHFCMIPSNGSTHLLKCSHEENVNGRFEQLG